MILKNEWEINQLVKAGLYSDSDAVLRSALNALFLLHPEQKQQMLTAAYRAGEISIGRAAELIGVSSAEMQDLFRQAGVEIHLGPENADDLTKEVKTFESS